ncbi:MAG: nucleotidyltransferase domain-containing protein [Myxococcaceae bacterium]|nr:nucleotidyltransferase domain-containing protein [Myxococcaceae bacterium]
MARSVAAGLIRHGFTSVAVSGSLARGDDGPGSDVDLWAIGPWSGRDEQFVREVPVTVFRSRPDQLTDLEWINRWDVERLVVLSDPEQHFERLRHRYARHKGALRRRTLRDAERESEQASAPRRAWLKFAVAVFESTGTRVPKWKHAVALLSPKQLEQLRRKLRLPTKLDRRRTLKLVQRAPAEAEALLQEPVPRWAGAEQHVRYGSLEEAVLKLRADLARWVGEEDVSSYAALSALKALAEPEPGKRPRPRPRPRK